MEMRAGLCVFSLLVLLTGHALATDSAKNAKKNSTKTSELPTEPKLPVPWKNLAANLKAHTPHHKKKVPHAQNHSNKSHSVQHFAGVHSKEDEAKFQADTEGVVVQPLPKDVAWDIAAKMKLAAQTSTPAPKKELSSPSPSVPVNSTTDAMAVLHHETEKQLHKTQKQQKGETQKQHTATKQQLNKTANSTSAVAKHPAKKHQNGLANFEKDMGVNTSHPKNQSETPTKVDSPSKKSHKGKKHNGKKPHSGKQSAASVNATGGDAMNLLHHEIAEGNAEPALVHTTSTTTTTTTTDPKVGKGLLHLREDMYLGGHSSRALNAVHAKVPAAAPAVVHSVISVGNKHHKKKYAAVAKVVLPADPMAAVHKEAQSMRPKPQSKPQETPPATPAPLKVQHPEEHQNGLARLDDVLGTNKTIQKAQAPNEPQNESEAWSIARIIHPSKHSSHGAKQQKKTKGIAPPVVQAANVVDKVDPISALHHELHPEDVKNQPLMKPATKVEVPPAPKVHESRRNNLRRLREDVTR